MSALTPPDSAAAFADARWDDLAPYFDELAERPLDDSNVEEWLADWSRLDSLVSEAAALTNFEVLLRCPRGKDPYPFGIDAIVLDQ